MKISEPIPIISRWIFWQALLILLSSAVNYAQTAKDKGQKPEISTSTDSIRTDSISVKADTFYIPADTMILVPAGEYIIGDNDELMDQRPAHKVKLNAYYIDIHEVTNKQYELFVEATGYRLPFFREDTALNRPQMPVVGISWEDANAYCQWAGKRLPAEAEWEVAARGGKAEAKYPFEGSPDEEKANYRSDPDKPAAGLKPVGQYPPNTFGLYDMAGNVWEWVQDYYSPISYKDSTDWKIPRGAKKGTSRVIRGGGWNYTEEFLRCSYRNYLEDQARVRYVGFRCAKDAE